MRNGTTFYLAQRQIEQITPVNYDNPNSNIYKLLFAVVLSQTAILAAISAITVTSLDPALANITKNFEILQEALVERLDNITETLVGLEESMGAIEEAVEAMQAVLDTIEGVLDATAIDVGLMLAELTEMAIALDAFILEFYDFAFGVPLIGGPFPDLAKNVDRIVEFLLVGPIGGNTDFENGVQTGVSEALDTPFMINDTIYDSVYHIISLIHEGVDAQNNKLDTISSTLSTSNELTEGVLDNVIDSNKTLGITLGVTGSILSFFTGGFENLITDQRDLVQDILVFLNQTFT